MTSVIKIKKDFVKEITTEPSSNKVRLLFFSINISLKKELLVFIQRDHNPSVIFVSFHYNILQLFPRNIEKFFVVVLLSNTLIYITHTLLNLNELL